MPDDLRADEPLQDGESDGAAADGCPKAEADDVIGTPGSGKGRSPSPGSAPAICADMAQLVTPGITDQYHDQHWTSDRMRRLMWAGCGVLPELIIGFPR